jgi:hypothetical protein
MPLKRRLIKIGTSKAVTIPPDWLKYYEDLRGEPVEDILMEIDDNITISVEELPKIIPGEEAVVPEEEIILPYPEGLDTDDEGRLAVAAHVANYERIHDYLKREKLAWEQVGLSMTTVKRAGQPFFKVLKIFNTTPMPKKRR